MQHRQTNEGGRPLIIGVLALQGAFEEHERCMKSIGYKTVQVRTCSQLVDEENAAKVDGMILPGGESTAMGLIADAALWSALRSLAIPMWGTCAGMILLAQRCVGTSAVIQNGQALIGGMDVLVCRNYFGSQISSFELDTPFPCDHERPFPGIFIRAPAILSVGPHVHILGKVMAAPCRQAALLLTQLEQKIHSAQHIFQPNVAAAARSPMPVDSRPQQQQQQSTTTTNECHEDEAIVEEEKKDSDDFLHKNIELPAAAHGTSAREVICAARKDNILITAFHPELTTDYRWHSYFAKMVEDHHAACTK